MPNFTCHGCGQATNTAQRRSGRCRICYSKKADLCRDCAFWELGPVAPALQEALKPRSRKRVGRVIKQCPARAAVRVNTLVADARNQCATLDGQWANHGFDADGNNRGGAYDPSGGYNYGGRPAEANQAAGFHCHNSDAANGQFDVVAQAILADFDDLYARAEPVGGGGDQPQADNDLERVMLIVMASAHERGGYINDRLVHRWDAPTLARHHFTTCFAGLANVAAAARLALAPNVLGSTAIEDMVFGKASVAYTYWRVMDDAGANRDDFVRMSAMLLHLWIKNAPVGAIGGADTFKPKGARGVVTPELRAAVLTGDGRAFTPAVERKLAALYACFDNNPPHVAANDRRFPDVGIHGNALLTANQKRFLQSLPPMDSAVHGVVATPCETAVRVRIRKMLGRVRGALNGVAAPGQVGQDLLAATNDVQRDAVIDTIVATLHKGLNWIETSSSDTPYTIYHGLLAGQANFGFISYADTGAANVGWHHVFPDCIPVLVVATFPGQSALVDMLRPAVVNDGRQNARRWYPQWRWDKDHRLYAGLGFAGAERGKVAQFTFHPRAPYPNRHYGKHTVIWDPAILERAVLMVDDKGRPSRSRMILLHDLLTCPPNVVGEATNAKPNTVRALVEFCDANHNVDVPNFVPAHGANAYVTGPAPPGAPAATPRTVLLDRVSGVIGRHADADFTDTTDSTQRVIIEDAPAQPVTPIVECHFFGPARLHTEAMLIMLDHADLDFRPPPPGPAPAEAGWVATFHPALAHPPFNTARFRALPPAVAAPWRQNRANPLPDPPMSPNALQGILAKVPTYSAE